MLRQTRISTQLLFEDLFFLQLRRFSETSIRGTQICLLVPAHKSYQKYFSRSFLKEIIDSYRVSHDPFPIQRKEGGFLSWLLLSAGKQDQEKNKTMRMSQQQINVIRLLEPRVLGILDTFVQMTCQVDPHRLLSLTYQVLFCAMIQQQKVGWHSRSPIFCCNWNFKLSSYVELKVLCQNSFVESQKFIILKTAMLLLLRSEARIVFRETLFDLLTFSIALHKVQDAIQLSYASINLLQLFQ